MHFDPFFVAGFDSGYSSKIINGSSAFGRFWILDDPSSQGKDIALLKAYAVVQDCTFASYSTSSKAEDDIEL